MSSLYSCKICNLENPEPSHFWRTHKITEASYYLQYMPRFDKLTNDPINYKNREQYLLTDFNSKINLKKWLKSNTIETQKTYLKESLLRRKIIKNLEYIPTQVELRSMDCMPGIAMFNEVFGDYYQLCDTLGFQSRGHKNINKNTILQSTRSLKKNTILTDTREQSRILFTKRINVEIATLPVGDYTLKENNYNIYIERKSLNDFVSTLGKSGFDRFIRELQKAQDLGIYIIMLVEEGFNDALSFEYKDYIARHTQASSAYIFHNVRTLLQKFPNFQVAFCNGRDEMRETIIKIYEMEDVCKKTDLQLAIDLGLLEEKI